jgi:hypothetical protein
MVPMPDTMILNDFEKANDLNNMYDQGGEYTVALNSAHATHGKMALMIEKNYDSNIELATVHFPRNWDGYHVLKLDIYNESDEAGNLWLRIGNDFDANRFYLESQKYTKSFPLESGANTVVIPTEDISKAFGRMPRRQTLHFNFPAESGDRYFLDFLRLERDDGTQK